MDKINKGMKLIKELKIKRLLRSLNIYLFGDFFLYQSWLRKNLNHPDYRIALTSTVMIYICDTNHKLLARTLNSIKKQTYSYYEVNVIQPSDLSQLLVTADYCLFLEAGDLLTKNCLCELMRNIKDQDAVYSDHDLYSRIGFSRPKFKPDFSIDLLRSYPYIHHAILFTKEVVSKVEASSFNAFMYEQMLNLFVDKRLVGHVPNILFHFRREMLITKTLGDILLKHYQQLGLAVRIDQSSFYFQSEYLPKVELVSIIIPNKDHADDLKKCIETIFKYTDPNLFEIIIVENNSETQEIFDYYDELNKIKNIRVVYWESIFNYSAINNFGATFANGDYLLFLNNDVEIINKDWLLRMLGVIQREEVGIVGAKLLYGDHKVQHGGIFLGNASIAAHMFLGQDENYQGYMYRAAVKQDLSAVTAACLMTKKDLFFELDGFEEELKVAFNDIDYCLRVRTKDKLIVFDPEVVLIHHESLSRGSDEVSSEKKQRFNSEVAFMKERWESFLLDGDPYYNINLTLDRTDYMIK